MSMTSPEPTGSRRRALRLFLAVAALAFGLPATRAAAREPEPGDDHGSGGNCADDPAGDDHGRRHRRRRRR